MPKKIDHEQRKKEILREALELFSSQGYQATTLADIAKAAHIARPTLYQYFRNKHQILFFASKQFTDEFLVYYEKVVQLKELAAIHRLRFILSHIVISCREKRRELVSQSAFILKLDKEGRSLGELIHKRTRPLKNMLVQLIIEAEGEKQLSCDNHNETVDLLLTQVSSGIVHVLLFPTEDCKPILRHIATVLSLLAERASPQTADYWEQSYPEVYQNLMTQLQQLREQDAKERAQIQQQGKHKILEELPGDEGWQDELDYDEEWDNFLNPFRPMD